MRKLYLKTFVLPLLVLSSTIYAQTISTIAGTGAAGYNGDNIAASIAQLNQPSGVKVDGSGNILVADFINNRVRKIGTDGFISTIAGNGNGTYNGDNIQGTAASLFRPEALSLDNAGNLFIEDTYNHRIRKLSSTGNIITVAGNGNGTYNGDNITATNASLNYPSDGVLADASGNIYISDSYNNRIRKVNSSGIITTIAGTGAQGYNGDNILATNATIYYPYALVLDAAGNLFFADGGNHRIRKISTTGIITTVAGTGIQGYNGDNIQATAATLNTPQGIAFDAAGNLYISDSFNNRIRKINKNTGVITTVVGTGTGGYNGDNISATLAQIQFTAGITFDAAGNLFIADLGNHRVRKVSNLILPLDLIKFNAQLQGSIGLLQWQTSSEINTQSFIVESGRDGLKFNAIGTVKANNASGSNNYTYKDHQINIGTTYYRLRMINIDGTFTYSNIVTIKNNASAILLNLYPNPANNFANLSFISSSAGKYSIQITDIAGRIIKQINGVAITGKNNLNIDLRNYVTGTYTLSTTTVDKLKASVKFIKN